MQNRGGVGWGKGRGSAGQGGREEGVVGGGGWRSKVAAGRSFVAARHNRSGHGTCDPE